MLNLKYFKHLIVATFFLSTFFATARVLAGEVIRVNEVMYNPVGTDSKHEWVEIKNISNSNLDISKLRLLESGVAHKINVVDDASPIILPGQYAIIADDAQTFLLDYANDSEIIGKVYDSVFSLVNTGEEISITNSDGEVLDTFTYDQTLGANGTGNTLQLTDSGQIIPATPTPAKENAHNAESETENESSQNATSSTSVKEGTSSHSSQTEVSNYNPKPKVEISIGRERIATINQPVKFFADTSISSNRRIIWNFGDGHTGAGKYAKHIFEFPGTYVVNSFLKYGNESAFDRTKITIINPVLDLIQIGARWGIKNLSESEINLGGWLAVIDENDPSQKQLNKKRQKLQKRQNRIRQKWKIPEDTILLEAGILPLPASFSPENQADCPKVRLDFPNGDTYKTLDCPAKI